LNQIQPARIEWSDATPYCPAFDDVYFSRDGGVNEVRHVFLGGNDLPARFQNNRTFTIGETGFGTGLNFLVTLATWQKYAPAYARLHFLSVEKHPLSHADLVQVLSKWPEFAAQAEALGTIYPPLVAGLHQRQLLDGRVTLTLLFGEVEAMLESVNAKVDAWYLDGFAPVKNPAMWTPAVMQQIARLTRPGGTIATYSAAGVVRRGLEAARFSIHKRPGYGRKRDMLTGIFPGEPQIAPLKTPWLHPDCPPAPRERHAVVIGAGVAGVSVAHALAEREWRITILEKQPEIATGASGNPGGIVLPHLTADMNRDGQFYLAAFLHSIAWLNRLQVRLPMLSWQQTGVLHLIDEARMARLGQLDLPETILEPLDQVMATKRAGLDVTSGGVFYPQAGWLRPPALCKALLADQARRISVLNGREVVRLERNGHDWQVEDGQGDITTAPVVILANGQAATRLVPDLGLGLEAVRGQLTYLPDTATPSLAMPVCYAGYVLPAWDGQFCVGATYDRNDDTPEPRAADTAMNLAALAQAIPDFASATASGGRVAFRTTSPDHLPVIGPVPDAAFYHQAYADLRHGRPVHHYPPAQYLPGLFLTTGHGSRGLVTGPLAGTLIAACLNQEPLPLVTDLMDSVHPGRFLIRKLKRAVV
jgi:tRNA 5-methylaminomethyl-2-thiouridine biosynthesis bifunctional protein